MSSGPTPISAIAQEYVQDFVQGEINEANKNAYANYENVFANWAIQQIGAPPAPPQLKILNQPLAIQLFLAYSNTAYQGPIGSSVAPLDLSSAISTVQAAAITLPTPPVIPPGQDEVGPLTGATTSYGGQTLPTAYTVTGDNSPLGTKSTDARGSFIKVGNQTPFGISSQWVLLPAST